jgi:aldose 1-epimerase
VTELVTLTQGKAKVEIAACTGGAIASFDWREMPVLRRTPTDVMESGDVRRHACYPLVPYSNRIEHGHLTFRGSTHELALNFGDHPHAIHGVGWQRPWQVQRCDATSALLGFEHRPAQSGEDPDTQAWPWAFRATQWFQLTPDERGGVSLRMRLTLTNTAEDSFPFGLGWHPFFPSNAQTMLQFSARGVWETDDTVIPTKHVLPLGRFDFERPRSITSAVLDHVYTGWTGEAQLGYADEARVTTLRGDTASTWFVVYIPPHHAFLAIEPVTQMTDAFNRAERGEQDTGTRLLARGDSFSCTMEIHAGAMS